VGFCVLTSWVTLRQKKSAQHYLLKGEDSMKSEEESSDTSLLTTEYNALRAEILKHMDIENQLATFTVIVFGTISSISFSNKNALLMLLYPILAMFLSIGWSQNNYQIRQIGTYIKERIESAVGTDKMGWENFLATNRNDSYFWGIRGIFIATELLAIVVGVTMAPFTTTFLAFIAGQSKNLDFTINVILGTAIVCLFITIFLLRKKPVRPITSRTRKV
jgi:hypothetical protein